MAQFRPLHGTGGLEADHPVPMVTHDGHRVDPAAVGGGEEDDRIEELPGGSVVLEGVVPLRAGDVGEDMKGPLLVLGETSGRVDHLPSSPVGGRP